MNTIDRIFMRRCFQLAERSAGFVSPNPMVGCVVVKEGRVIAEGRHERFGGAHAEPNAINNCPEPLDGATLYCNLEPCSHTNKKTPPCTPLIINSGIKRVVISSIDPNPLVSGRGVELLRNSGIEVETGVLEEAGNYLNRFFFKHIKTGLPYVTLKIAQSADGYITARKGTQTSITGKESAEYVHSLRAKYDAVLVGANTVNVDNPQLNVRYAVGRNPKRVIVDGNLSSNPDAGVFNDEDKNNTLLFVSRNAPRERIDAIKSKGVKVFEMDSGEGGKIDLKEILLKLGQENTISLLVEGGANIFTRFVLENLFDEVITLTSPLVLEGGVHSLNCDFPPNLKKIEENSLGNDLKKVFLNSII